MEYCIHARTQSNTEKCSSAQYLVHVHLEDSVEGCNRKISTTNSTNNKKEIPATATKSPIAMLA